MRAAVGALLFALAALTRKTGYRLPRIPPEGVSLPMLARISSQRASSERIRQLPSIFRKFISEVTEGPRGTTGVNSPAIAVTPSECQR